MVECGSDEDFFVRARVFVVGCDSGVEGDESTLSSLGVLCFRGRGPEWCERERTRILFFVCVCVFVGEGQSGVKGN